MLKRTFLTPADRKILSEPTEDPSLMAAFYTFRPQELGWIAECRGDHNRLGFAVSLAYMKLPGIAMPHDATPPLPFLQFIAEQIGARASDFARYSERPETRRNHLTQLREKLSMRSYTEGDRATVLASLRDRVLETDRGTEIAIDIKNHLREKRILLPVVNTIEDLCRDAITDGENRIYQAIGAQLSRKHIKDLNDLLVAKRPTGEYVFTWLKKTFTHASGASVNAFLEQHYFIAGLNLPPELRTTVPPRRFESLARFAGNAHPKRLRELSPLRRNATLAAFAITTGINSKDCAVKTHERIMLNLHASTRSAANKEFVADKKELRDDQILGARVIRAMLNAHATKTDPWESISAIASEEELDALATRGENLAKHEKYEPLPLVKKSYQRIHQYTHSLLGAIEWKNTSAGEPLVEAFEAIQRMKNKDLPDSALPREFVTGKWRNLVFTKEGVDRKYYEICALSRMREALASGDLSIVGSKVFRDIESDLPSVEVIDAHIGTDTLGIGLNPVWPQYRDDEFSLLHSELKRVNDLAARNLLPDGAVDPIEGLHLDKLESIVPTEVAQLRRKIYGSMPPSVKITDILIDIDQGERISRHFRHVTKGHPHPDKRLLWTTILALGTNQGLARMANACLVKTTFSDLQRTYDEYFTDEACNAAVYEMNLIFSENPYASIWGDGLKGSSDGQWFPVSGLGVGYGSHNPHRGSEPGSPLYTHLTDQYFPYRKKPLMTAAPHEALYVWDAKVDNKIGSRIIQHSTDTGGYSDLNFGAATFFPVDYAPRIRNIDERKIYLPPSTSSSDFPALKPLLGRRINADLLEARWKDILRIGCAMVHGLTPPSVLLRKLRGTKRQNSMAAGLNELGYLRRSLYILKWISDPQVRRQVEHILNKGEAVNKLSRALAFHRHGELQDQTYEGQENRANALTILTAAIVIWNARGLSHITQTLTKMGEIPDPDLLRHISPAAWEHINLTGVYDWDFSGAPAPGSFRPLRAL